MLLADLLQVERDALLLLLAGNEPRVAMLRDQLAHVVAVTRSPDPVGLYVEFELSPSANPLSGLPDLELTGVQADSPGAESIGFILFVRGGRISMLEGYVAGDRYPHEPEREFRVRRYGG